MWDWISRMARCIRYNILLSVTCNRSVVLPGPAVSSTNKTNHHDISEKVLKMALNTATLTMTPLNILKTELARMNIYIIEFFNLYLYTCLSIWYFTKTYLLSLYAKTIYFILLSILDFNRTYNKVQQEVSEWPSEYDLLAATRALLRLRTTYNLDIDLLIRGVIYDEQTHLMTWPLMELIMEEAEESEMFDEALLWCDAVLSLPLSFHRSNATKIEMSVKQIKARIYNEVYHNK